MDNKIRIKIIIILILLFSNLVQSRQTYNAKETERERIKLWEEELRKYKIPPKAIKLKLLFSIPHDQALETTDQDVFFKQSGHMGSDSRGSVIYVSDSRLNRILAFNLDGRYLLSVGSAGNGPGELNNPTQVCVSDTGEIIVNDAGNGRIEIFDPQGRYVRSFKTYKAYSSLYLNAKQIFVTPLNFDPQKTFLVDIINLKGDLINRFGELMEVKDSHNMLNEVMLCVSEEKDVYIAWRFQNVLRRYSLDGGLVNEIVLNRNEKMNYNTKYNKEAAKNENMKGYKVVICSMCANDNKVFLMRYYPRIDITELNRNGSVENAYYADQEYNSIYSDVIVRNRAGEKYFYVLELFPDNRICVFTE